MKTLTTLALSLIVAAPVLADEINLNPGTSALAIEIGYPDYSLGHKPWTSQDMGFHQDKDGNLIISKEEKEQKFLNSLLKHKSLSTKAKDELRKLFHSPMNSTPGFKQATVTVLVPISELKLDKDPVYKLEILTGSHLTIESIEQLGGGRTPK